MAASASRSLGRKAIALLVVASLLGSAIAQPASSLQGLLKAYGNEQYEQAVPGLRSLAAAGDVTAQAYLCEAALLGRGMDKSWKPTADCQAAYKSGSLKAKGLIARYLLVTTGSERDPARALQMAEEAARDGDAYSMVTLGQDYAVNKQDYASALAQFERARPMGSATASYFLALMYMDGRGVKKDSAKALALLNEAVSRHSPDALLLMGKLHQTGELVPKDINEAARYYEAASKRHVAEAGYRLYVLIDNSKNRMSYLPAARQALGSAAKEGYPQAQLEYGLALWHGTLGSANREEAIGWYRAAASNGVAKGRLLLATGLAQTGHERDAGVVLTALVRDNPDPDVTQEAGLWLAYLIHDGKARGSAADVEWLLSRAEASGNAGIAAAARQTRKEFQDSGVSREGRNEAMAVGLLALLAAGILVSNAVNAPEAKPGEDDGFLARANRGLQCSNAIRACSATCAGVGGAWRGVCQNSCNNTC